MRPLTSGDITPDKLSNYLTMKVDAVADPDAVTIGPGRTLRQAAIMMRSASVAALAVVGNGQQLRGLVTEADLVTRLAGDADPDLATVEEAAHFAIESARTDDLLHEVAYRMLEEGVQLLPVVNREGALTGMVSLRNVLDPLLIEALG